MSATEISDIEKCGWTLAIDGKEPGKELGSGHFAKVRMAQRKSDGLKAACKIIKKPKGVHPGVALPSTLPSIRWPGCVQLLLRGDMHAHWAGTWRPPLLERPRALAIALSPFLTYSHSHSLTLSPLLSH